MYALLWFLILASIKCVLLQNLKGLFEWRTLNYVFPSSFTREQAIQNGQFVPNNGVPIDVDVEYRRNNQLTRVFVTIPRFTTGIPVTLGYITGRGNHIQPYPSYSWHDSHGQDCDDITSAFRVAIDKCRRLWVLDSGVIDSQLRCAPQLLVFDLKTDTLIHRYRFPANQTSMGTSLFITPVLDVKDPPPYGTCSDTMVYIADTTAFGLIVYSSRANRSWRIENKLFYPNPNFGTHTVAGESFDLMDGIFALALSPPSTNDANRCLYFHALASNTENCVRLDIVNNATIWDSSADSLPMYFHEIGHRQSQATAQAMDCNGNLYFGLETPSAIQCWDSRKPFTRKNLRTLVQNEQTLQFISAIKVVMNKKGKEELFTMSCRFQKIMTGTFSPSETNFRIQAIRIDELLDHRNRC